MVIIMQIKKGRLQARRDRKGYLFILPWFIGFTMFFAYPVIQSALNSFTELEIGKSPIPVGFKNFYDAFFTDSQFPQLLYTSFINMLRDVPILLISSLFVAILLKQNFRGSKVVKGIFFLTVILSSGVFLKMQAETAALNNAQMSSAMNDASGAIQSFRDIDLSKYLLDAGVGEQYVAYVGSAVSTLFTIMTQSGIQIFIFLAGLNSISPSVYEACYIEGATAWEAFWKITFPLITPLILVNAVYTIIDSFTAYTNTTLSFIYDTAFVRLSYGYASALSWVYFLLIGIVLGALMLLMSKRITYQT